MPAEAMYSALTKQEPAQAPSVPANPIPGNIYYWLSHGDKKSTSGKYAGAISIVLLQMVTPIAIAWYYCTKVDWDSIDINFLMMTEINMTATGNSLPLWPNVITQKLIAVIGFLLFVTQLLNSFSKKGFYLGKVKCIDYLAESSGEIKKEKGTSEKFWECLGFNILAVAYLLTVFATWISILFSANAGEVFGNLTGLMVLTNLDELSGFDLSPLTDDDWEAQEWGNKYYTAMKKAYPDEDPDALVAGSPAKKFFEEQRISGSQLGLIVGVGIFVCQVPLALLFLFIDQTKVQML